MPTDCIAIERLEELQENNARLRILVCEFLLKNQELRTQLSAEEDNLCDWIPERRLDGQPCAAQCARGFRGQPGCREPALEGKGADPSAPFKSRIRYRNCSLNGRLSYPFCQNRAGRMRTPDSCWDDKKQVPSAALRTSSSTSRGAQDDNSERRENR